jgi:hypothetical protein
LFAKDLLRHFRELSGRFTPFGTAFAFRRFKTVCRRYYNLIRCVKLFIVFEMSSRIAGTPGKWTSVLLHPEKLLKNPVLKPLVLADKPSRNADVRPRFKTTTKVKRVYHSIKIIARPFCPFLKKIFVVRSPI